MGKRYHIVVLFGNSWPTSKNSLKIAVVYTQIMTVAVSEAAWHTAAIT